MAIGKKLNGTLRKFIERQPLFFVATAGRDGRVNVSPKGMDTLRIVSDNRIVWLNLSGSGNETAAHIRDVNRMTLMFCAFEGRPLIVRVHGTGEVVEANHEKFASLSAHFDDYPGVRSIIVVRASRISDSCGYGVPLYEHKGERDQLQRWATSKGDDGIAQYQQDNNAESLDGLPSLLGDH